MADRRSPDDEAALSARLKQLGERIHEAGARRQHESEELREEEAKRQGEPTNLAQALRRVYASARYERRIDYGKAPPLPELSADDTAWIDWEIRTAVSLKKKLIGVKISKSYESPAALLDNNATWAMSWTFDAIKKAVDEA